MIRQSVPKQFAFFGLLICSLWFDAHAIADQSTQVNEPHTEFERLPDSQVARLQLDFGKATSMAIPAELFGTFTENIWEAVYGGIWAQILVNPSFEPDYLSMRSMLDANQFGRLVSDPSFNGEYVRLEPLAVEPGHKKRFEISSESGLPVPWELLRVVDGARYFPNDGDAPNSNRSLLLMGLPGKEVGVRQGIYLPVHRTREIKGTLWLKWKRSESFNEQLKVSLRRRDKPDQIIAETTVGGVDRQWRKKPFKLTIPYGGVQSSEKVDFVLSVQGDHRIMIDNVLLWPSDEVQGFDPEVLQAAQALRTPILRFGGNFTSAYNWKDGVGDSEKRKTMLNTAWGLPEYNHFGTDEFIRLSRLIGAEPQIAVNAGTGEPEEAAEWVEYANGALNTTNGNLRFKNGNSLPFTVKYWEVGNELWGTFQHGWQTAETNAERFVEFAKAMKASDPSIRLIATGADVDFFNHWNGELLSKAGRYADYIATHLVIGMHPNEQVNKDAPDEVVHRADFAVPVGVGRKLDEMRAQVDSYPETKGRLKLAFTEWQFWSPRSTDPRFDNLGGAINAAAFYNMLLRRADFVQLSNISNLVHFGGIHRQRGRVFLTPTYDVLKLYSKARDGRLVALKLASGAYDVTRGNRRAPEVKDVPYIDALAVEKKSEKLLLIYLVNRDLRSARDLEVTTSGIRSASSEIVMRRLGGASIASANTPEFPDEVKLTEMRMPWHAKRIPMTLPPHSLTVLEVRTP